MYIGNFLTPVASHLMVVNVDLVFIDTPVINWNLENRTKLVLFSIVFRDVVISAFRCN